MHLWTGSPQRPEGFSQKWQLVPLLCVQEGNKQSLLAQLTRKHWAAITAMAQALSTGAGGSTPPSPNSTPPRTSGAGAADAADASCTPGAVAATADSMAGAIAQAVADATSGPALATSGASAVVAGTTPSAPPRPPRSASEDAGSVHSDTTLKEIYEVAVCCRSLRR